MTKKQRKKLNKTLFILLQVLFILIFIYAGMQLISIFSDYKRASDEYDTLAEAVVEETPVNETKEEKEEEEKKQSVLDLPFDYAVPTYEVDLASVKKQNPDTVGWIILPDSKINYPIVKSKDNTEYLTTTFEGQNAIVYGHNMKNGSMFRALNNLTDKEYFWRHHIFCIDTGNGFEEYEIISCYETTEEDLTSWHIGFESQDAYAEWLKTVVSRCNYDCADYDVEKNTITLSTCRGASGGPGRFIVHLQKK